MGIISAVKTGEKPVVKKEFHLRRPDKEDGAHVWELIKHTGNLDLNSSYSYIMWCEVFSETSIVALEEEMDKEPVGFISGFIHPEKPDTLFIWQVAVHESTRGQGLATRMLNELLEREACSEVEYIEATVGKSNIASNNLFIGIARNFHSDYRICRYFDTEDFPEEEGEEEHEDELLYRIGPLNK